MPVGERPWRAGSKTFRAFLRGLPGGGPLVVLAGAQPDGLTAGHLLRRVLGRGGRPVRLLFPPKGEDAGGQETRARLARLAPAAVIVAGLGGAPPAPLADVPTLVLARWPAPATAGVTVISSAGWEPPVSAGVLAYWLAQAVAEMRRLDWVAAVGAMAAFGDRVPSPVVIGAKATYGGDWLRECVALLLAAARAAEPEPETAARLLLAARDPKDLIVTERPERARLLAARAEVEAAIERSKAIAPTRRAPVALVEVASPCAVQGVLAHIWSRRVAGPALVTNSGYLPGRVAFALAAPAGDRATRLKEVLPAGAVLDREYEEGVAGHVATAAWPAVLTLLGRDA